MLLFKLHFNTPLLYALFITVLEMGLGQESVIFIFASLIKNIPLTTLPRLPYSLRSVRHVSGFQVPYASCAGTTLSSTIKIKTAQKRGKILDGAGDGT